MLSKFRFPSVVILVLALGVVLCSFWPSLFNGFTLWDDNIYVAENEMIRDLSWPSLKAMFTTDVSLNYTPLTSLSFAVEYHFFGYQPFVYHLDNLLLHILVTALIFVFTRQISASLTVAAVAALLFGIHPMHVESVAWITERKDVLYASFYMAALIFYWRYLTDRRKVFYLLSLVCGCLSILSKPMALSLPFVLFILDWFFRRKIDKKIFFEKVPFCFLIFPVAWLTYSLNSRAIAVKFPDAVLTWLWTFVFYIKKFLLPFDFLPLYQLPHPVKITHPEFAFACVATVLIISALIRWRQNRWLVFSFLFYFISIFFLLRYDDKVDLCIVADRFMYLPSVGFCILLAVYFEKALGWIKNKSVSYQTGFLVIVISCILYLGSTTYNQSKIWGDGIAFWNGVLKRYPDAAMAYNQRALAYKQKGDLENALSDYTKAINLFPDYDFALTNRGILYKELGRYQQAWEDHSQAIKVNPGFSEAYLNRGNVLFSAGDFKGAVADYDQAIKTVSISARRGSTPYRAEVYSRRGAGYFFAKEYDVASKDFDQALEIDPDNIVALDNRAIIFSIRGEKDKALADFNRSLQLVPQNPVNYVNRAQLYYQSGDHLSALRDLETALAIRPDYQRALDLKAVINK
ncbi:MAG: tetratricopeptide repeat protein [Candidatus Omnitrophica bacterium]|nr:tetratricopeptide repeat protein [Candidatus Omnitrophota bacterium]